MNTSQQLRPTPQAIEEYIYKTVLLAAVLMISFSLALSPNAVLDADVGWHLMTGEWIVAHKQIPYIDPFSTIDQGKPWVAYSWLFEIILWCFYKMAGLTGLVFFTATMTFAITIAVMLLARLFSSSPAFITTISAVGIIAMMQLLITPRPWLFTILFFTLEIHILLSSAERRNHNRLFWLPVIFLLWSNLAIQFFYGLFALFLFASEPYYSRFLAYTKIQYTQINSNSTRAWHVFFMSLAATIINPYGHELYLEIWKVMGQTGVYNLISEMLAMNFRVPANWVTLFICLLSVYMLGRGAHPVKSFIAAIYFFGIILAFRSLRDAWFLVIPGLVIIMGSISPANSKDTEPFSKSQWIFAILAAVTWSYILIKHKDLDEHGLQRVLSNNYPVSAVFLAKQNNYPGPLFNHYDWGGFLIWQLPDRPVSIDGRANLHGVESVENSLNVWRGRHDWQENKELAASRLIIARRDDPLTSLLKFDNRFESVYEDNISSLFVRR